MQTFKLTAHLRHGYVARNAWSPAIDGIVGYQHLMEKLGPDEFAISAAQSSQLRPTTGLPFDIVRDGEHWWYAVSAPIRIGFAGRETKSYHRRFDDRHERFLDAGTRKVMTAAGPYKNARLHETRWICRAVEWHCVGDPAEAFRLASQIVQIGASRQRGYGEVLRWELSLDADEKLARFHRPLPVAYATERGITGLEMVWPLAPPGRCPEVQARCILPSPDLSAAA